MYLVGTFRREYYDWTNNENPMSLVFLVDEIRKDHLQNAARDEEYQVINLITREFFDAKANRWVKIERL